FFFSSRRRHTRSYGDWSSDVCSSDLISHEDEPPVANERFRKSVIRIRSASEDRLLLGLMPSTVVLLSEEPGREDWHERARKQIRSEERRVGKREDNGGGRSSEKKE